MAENIIVVIGDGQHARLLEKFPGVLGYTDPLSMDSVLDFKTGEVIEKLSTKHKGVIGIANPKYKKEAYDKWLSKGLELETLIHPKALILGNAGVGEGSVIFPLAYVDEGSEVGKMCTVLPYSVVHKSLVDDFSHITFGAKLNLCKLGKGVFIGSNSVVLEDRQIGDWSVIGAGSKVTRDIPPKSKLIQKVENQSITSSDDFVFTQNAYKRRTNTTGKLGLK